MGITWCETTRDGDWDGTRRGGGTLLNTILTLPPYGATLTTQGNPAASSGFQTWFPAGSIKSYRCLHHSPADNAVLGLGWCWGAERHRCYLGNPPCATKVEKTWAKNKTTVAGCLVALWHSETANDARIESVGGVND